jgi:hypothetical protein
MEGSFDLLTENSSRKVITRTTEINRQFQHFWLFATKFSTAQKRKKAYNP